MTESMDFPSECLKDCILVPRTFLGRNVSSGTELSLYVQNYSKLKNKVIYYISHNIWDVKWTCKLVIANGTLFTFLSTNAEFKNPAVSLCNVSGERVENDIASHDGLLVSEFCHKAIRDPKNTYLNNDCLIIQFKYDTEPSQNINYFANYGSPNHIEDGIELCRNFKYLYLTACCADLKIQVRDETFWVHKAVLSVRSKLFEIFFQKNQPSPKKLTCIAIDEDPFHFHKVLIYIYCGEFDYVGLDEKDWLSVCKIANRLKIDILENKCVDMFKSIFTKENVVSILYSAKGNKLPILLEAAICYMVKNDMSSTLRALYNIN